MMLALDLGNSNLTLGVYEEGRLVQCRRLSTDARRTADEWAVWIERLLPERIKKHCEGALLASVVPPATEALSSGVQIVTGVTPVVVTTNMTGLAVDLEHPEDLGADRAVNAVSALQKMRPPLIVVDFGTATTLDVVDGRGTYIGGAILPGMGISTAALFERAAQLHPVDLVAPGRVIGRSTRGALQSGIVLGTALQVDALIAAMEAELSHGVDVIATGGLAKAVAQASKRLSRVDPFLTIDGLHAIHRSLKERSGIRA